MMGRREKRRKATRAEKQKLEVGSQKQRDAGRGRIGFEDLSPITQGVVIDIARRMKCTREEIVEVLNQ